MSADAVSSQLGKESGSLTLQLGSNGCRSLAIV